MAILSFFRRHKVLAAILVLVVLFAGFMLSRMKGPHRFYSLDMVVPASAAEAPAPGQLQVGVAMRDITPDFSQYDTWNDADGNGKYEKPGWFLRTVAGIEDKGDTFVDRNGNGEFDPLWIAGFSSFRPAQGVNDPLSTRALALRNNGVTLVMVTIDSIGIFHNAFVSIRKMLDKELGIDHVMFSTTHSHEVPDTMGIWSGIPILGYDDAYLKIVMEKTKEAIEEAVRNLQPADMHCVQFELDPEGFVRDSRKPVVMDNNVYCMRFTQPASEETIATFVSWGNHPEALGGDNLLISADFCGYLREGVEKGVPEPNGAEGLGGMCLYFQGQIGGLMTQLGITIPHRNGVDKFKEDSFDKAQAQGENLAIAVLKALRSDDVWKNENPYIAVAAQLGKAPMAGHYKYAIMLGLLHEGYYWGGKSRTEINAIRIGDVEILTTPGEIYPEIVEGGVVALPGRDFEIEPLETPPLRTAMQGRMNFVIGQANDSIGYIIPKSQWDTEAPWVYGDSDQYGEQNSGGPEIGSHIHKGSLEVLAKLHGALPETLTARAE